MRIQTVFRMPTPVKITGRTSSITNAFVNGIIPCLEPTAQEVHDALAVLGMDEHAICCAYCGAPHTEWDHFRPLIIDQQPTGYISEIHNLVPACGKCNQSKGNKYWRDWMFSPAPLSPHSRSIVDLLARVKHLEAFESWGMPIRLDFQAIVGDELWEAHWQNHRLLCDMMRQSQMISNQIRQKILDAL